MGDPEMRGAGRREDASLLEPIHAPESAQESDAYEPDHERRRWEEDRPPHYDPR